MGLGIKRNKKGQYQLISTISDESYHPDKKWITEDEAKVILINKAFWEFVKTSIEIDMEFPANYYVNGKYCNDKKPNFNIWMLKNAFGDNGDVIITEKFEDIHKRLKLNINITNKSSKK